MTRRGFAGLRSGLDAQLGLPEGRGGWFVLRVLDVVNARLNRATVDALALAPGERVLDVGFGGGVGVRRAVRTGARVTAIDPSAMAVEQGRARLPAEVSVCVGDAGAPGVGSQVFDAVYSVNTVYFWPGVDAALEGLRGALRPGGRLALGIETRELRRHARIRVGLPDSVGALGRRIERAGFESASVVGGPGGRCVLLAVRG